MVYDEYLIDYNIKNISFLFSICNTHFTIEKVLNRTIFTVIKKNNLRYQA